MSEKDSLLSANAEHVNMPMPSTANLYGTNSHFISANKHTKHKWHGVSLGWILLAILLSSLAGLDVVILSVLNGASIDLLLESYSIHSTQEMSNFKNISLFFIAAHVVFMLILFLLAYVQNLVWRHLSEELLRKASVACFQRLLKQPISWWDRQHSGNIYQDVNKQMADIRSGLGENVGKLMQTVASMVSVTLLVPYIKWWLVFSMAIIAFIDYYGSVIIEKTGAVSVQTAHMERRVAAHISSETITHMRTVHAYNAQTYQLNKLTYRLIADGEITVGIIMTSSSTSTTESAVASHECVRVSRLPAIETVEMRDISFSYPSSSQPDVKVLSSINLTLRKNETVALIGHTGSGKSTVINLLLAFYKNYSGEILINDHYELCDIDESVWRSHLGVVSQQCVLLDTTVIDNVRAGRHTLTHAQCVHACKQANAHEFIMAMPQGYDTEIQAANLSGGQQQRLAIARALVGDPDVLILDEPTASLDTQNELLVEHAIDRAKVNRATLLISHSLSLAESADHVIVLSKGVVLERGSPTQLMQNKGAFMAMIEERERKAKKHSIELETSKVVRLDNGTKTTETISNSMQSVKTPSLQSSRGNAKYLSLPVRQILVCFVMCLLAACSTLFLSIFTIGSYMVIFERNATLVLYIGCGLIIAGIISGLIQFSMVSQFRPRANEYNNLQTYSFSVMAEKFSTRLHGLVMKQIVRLPIQAFSTDEFNQNVLLAILFEHNDKVKAGLDWRLSQVISSLLALLLSVLFLSAFDWRLLPLAVLGMPMISAGHFLMLHVAQLRKRTSEKSAKVQYEAFQKIRTIRFLNLDQNFVEQYESLLTQESSDTVKSAVRFEGIAVAYAKISLIAFSAVGFVYGVWMVFYLQMSPFSIILARVVTVFVSLQLGMTITYVQNFKQAKHSWTILKQFVELDDSDPPITNHPPKYTMDGSVSFQEVRFHYSKSEKRVLKNISFDTKPKALTAIVGRSGSGKSTCLQLIERFYDVSDGSVIVNGKNIQKQNIHRLRASMAWLSQNPVLFDTSVAENIRYGSFNLDVELMERCAQLACAHEFIAELPQGYDTSCGEGGLRFSGGQRQRIALARALYRRPSLLLLDEATSAIDVHTERVILENLRQQQLSMILVTHRLAAAEMADQVLVMKDGKLVQTGTHAALCEQPGHYQHIHLGSNMSDAVDTEPE